MTVDRSGDFNLLRERWIMVRDSQEQITEQSIRDVLVHSTDFRALAGDAPTQTFAILRVLLAVLHRAVDGPADNEDWAELWRSGPPTALIEDYCTRWEDRFWLFDDDVPFFQVPDLHTSKGQVTGLDRIIADVPPKDPFFTVRLGPAVEHITAPEAARWLVHSQAFDPSGIKSGAVGDPRVTGGKGYPIGVGWAGNIGGLIIEGQNLWETLLFNLIPRDTGLLDIDPEDVPVWERDELPGAAEDPLVEARPYGPLDLYTWQSRRIRLFGDRESVTGVLVCNGDRLRPQNQFRREPMTSWRRSKPQEKALKTKPVYMPREHRQGRALWRGIESILPALSPTSAAQRSEPGDALVSAMLEWLAGLGWELGEVLGGTLRASLRVHALGIIYGSNNAVIDGVVDDRLDLDTRLLLSTDGEKAGVAQKAVEASEAGVRALAFLARTIERAAGAVDKDGGEGAGNEATSQAYQLLGSAFLLWLPDLAESSDANSALLRWHQTAKRIVSGLGRDLLEDCGPAAFVGRTVTRQTGTVHISAAEASLIFDRQLRSSFSLAYPAPDTNKEQIA